MSDRDTITAADAYRLLFALGEARAKLRQSNDGHVYGLDALEKAHNAVVEAADELWVEWLAEQSR